MLPLVALAVASFCVYVSARHLMRATAPTRLDHETLVEALEGEVSFERFRAFSAGIASVPEADWERELVFAMTRTEGDERVGRINELLRDLDHAVTGGARVPRISASISASSGIMLASLALRSGLGVATDLPLEVQQYAIRLALHDGVDVAAVGIAGAIVCILLGQRATRAAKRRQICADRLVERLEAIAPSVAAWSSSGPLSPACEEPEQPAAPPASASRVSS